MLKKFNKFFVFLFFTLCFFIFNKCTIFGASTDFFNPDITDRTAFTSFPNLNDIDISKIKNLISVKHNLPDGRLDNQNKITCHYKNSNDIFYIYLFPDYVDNDNNFIYDNNQKSIYLTGDNLTYPLRYFVITFEPYIKDGVKYYQRGVNDSSFSKKDYFRNIEIYSDFEDSSFFYSNFNIIDKNSGDTLKVADFGDSVDKEVEIGDPSSRLKLSYEYNQDYTECHVNATLENGAFTDRIFYSNYMPSIAGQGLLSKQAFPRERYNFKRKSVLILSS